MTTDKPAMGLLLRPDAYYAETAEGVYFLSHHGESALSGRSAHQVIERMARFLDGRHTLLDLTADLAPERRDMVRGLVTALLARGVIREVPVGEVELGDADLETTYVGYFRDSARYHVQRFRRTVALTVGTGVLHRAVASRAVAAGLRSATGSRCDVVLHASDRPAAEDADRLERWCADAGVPVAHALALNDAIWIAGAGGVGWSSCRRRLRARRSGQPDAAPLEVGELAATVAASQLVHDVFQTVTAVAGAGTRQLTRLDPLTLASEVCAVLPHPFARDVVRSDRADLPASMPPESWSERAMVCVGDHVGVLGVPTERTYSQIPLHVCAIEVSDPVGLLDPREPLPSVFGAGADFATARRRAALSGLACYGSLMVDPRRLDFVDGRPADPGCDPDQTLMRLRSGQSTGLVRGYGLADDNTHLVDVVKVFPALRTPVSAYRPQPGVAAGHDWNEAVTLGLLDHCLRLTMAGLAGTTVPFAAVDLDGAALDANGERCRALVGAIGEPVTVYDLTRVLGVPTMVCCLGSTPAGCASGVSVGQALTGAMEQALLRYQARLDRQPSYAPPPVGDLPVHLRGGNVVRPPEVPAMATADLAAILLARGLRPVAVPLDHDPEVCSVLPHVVHVLLADG
jgi:hypothetical protein